MSNDEKKFLLSGDWDRVIAALSDKDSGDLGAEDYTNRAFARCFQQSKDHKDGNYSDVVEDAAKALIEDCKNPSALCAQAYGFYLNGNYEQAISVCEEIISCKECDIKQKEQEAKEAADATQKNKKTTKKDWEDKDALFAHELLGKIYTDMGNHLEASRRYKKALLYRQREQPVFSASPLLMDAYRDACKRVKGN
jgi:tetratricopeptide (TPR) repeat protein